MYYIVIVDKHPKFSLMYNEKYHVFDDKEKAIEYATKFGYKNTFSIKEDFVDGRAQTYMCGEYAILILAQEKMNW